MTARPTSIQRKRTKGWRAPPGTIMCTRPGKWGNPYVVLRYGQSWEVYDRNSMTDDPIPCCLLMDCCQSKQESIDCALRRFRVWLRRPENLERFRTGLAGAKYLGCWCTPSSSCHVDVIIQEVFGDG